MEHAGAVFLREDAMLFRAPPTAADRLRRANGVTLLDRPANNTVNLVLNTTAGPLRDVRVRRAIMYAMNRKADKPAVFAGWREMNDYMRENKIETVPATAVAAARQAAGGQGFSIGIGSPGTRTASGLMKNCNSTCLIGRPLQADQGADLDFLVGKRGAFVPKDNH